MALGLGFAILGVVLLTWGPDDRVDMAASLILTGLSMASMRAITDGPVGG